MIASKFHNDIFVKKVTPITDLFVYDNVVDEGFPNLPSEAVVLDDTLVNQYKGEDDEAYMHHPTLYRKYGKVYCMHTIHDYDEDASGEYVSLAISDDDGLTWSHQVVMPQMADMDVHGTYPTQWSYPALFLDLPSGLYALINTVDGLTAVINYQPLGTLIRKINSNDTLGTLQWVNNGVDEDDRTAPVAMATYPSYSFASESLIDEVQTYIKQKEYRPKILFGWSEVWSTQENSTIDSSNLREPTEIRPYNYPFSQSLKFWKPSLSDFNIIQDTDDNSTQAFCEVPVYRGSPVTRLYNYSPEIIIMVNPTANTTPRIELALNVCRKNNATGKYHIANNDTYMISATTKTAPVWSGFNKLGGMQLPFINRVGKDLLDIAFSVSKEEIYFKTVDISKLL